MKLPTEQNNLPPAKKWYRLVGPGAIMLATSLGSGEIYFWPNLSASYGAWVLIVAFIAISIQYVINTEVSRYTIATGETIIHGFNRLWKPLPWVILLCCTLPWIWPGWSMGGATALTWLIGGDAIWYGVVSLLLVGILLSLGRTLYKSLELTQLLLIGLTVVLMLLIFGVTRSFTSIPDVVVSFSPSSFNDFIRTDILILLSAIAFCGAGGTINLTQSHYVREKGFGMSHYDSPLSNPLISTDRDRLRSGFIWAPTAVNIERWKQWWAEGRKEQLVSFLIAGMVGLVLLSLIAVNLIGDEKPLSGMTLLSQEMDIIKTTSGFLSIMFAILVTCVFFTSEVGVLDHVCRLTSDIAYKKGIIDNSSRWRSEGAIYLLTLWIMIFIGIYILLGLNIKQPPQLLVIAGALSGVAMFIYSIALVSLNVRANQAWHETFKEENSRFSPFELPLWRWIMLGLACVVFGAFSILVVISKF